MIVSNRVSRNRLLVMLRGMVCSLVEPLCLGCGKPIEINRRWLCMVCEKEIWDQTKCRMRRIDFGRFVLPITFVLDYSQVVSNLIIEFKYRGKPSLAKLFSELMVRSIPWAFDSEALLVPVPMHKTRLRERGYNQSHLLCNEISRQTGLRLAQDLLIKTSETKAQATLSGNQRLENLKGVFTIKVREENLSNVLLVDDVVTTGTTLCRCAEALLSSGAERVSACVIASSG